MNHIKIDITSPEAAAIIAERFEDSAVARQYARAPSLFTADDYAALASVVFRDDYPGNATAHGVIEAPNGDGNLDATKRYAHIATKYLAQWPATTAPDYRARQSARDLLGYALLVAYGEAMLVARRLGVPAAMMPSFEHGALRVLEYPAGAGSAVHTDVGLLTLNLYRDQPNMLETYHEGYYSCGVQPYHLGRIATLIGLGPAAPHRVAPSTTPQHSIVYFAVPDHAAELPDGRTVGDFITTEMAKMRSKRTNEQY